VSDVIVAAIVAVIFPRLRSARKAEMQLQACLKIWGDKMRVSTRETGFPILLGIRWTHAMVVSVDLRVLDHQCVMGLSCGMI
jgi:hypothetical protein